jgi:hypothetical protein
MNAREAATRERARLYEIAIEGASVARERLDQHETKLAAPQNDVQALREIVKLAPKIPASITTRGTALSPGGQCLQVLILSNCEAALSRLTAERKQLEAKLPEARARASETEAYLESFETGA